MGGKEIGGTYEMTELERNNKTAMVAHLITVAVMAALILARACKGEASFVYAGTVCAVGVVPVALEFFFWNKNRETGMIRHLAGIGFALFYTICLFTQAIHMVYIFVIPMVFVVSVYNNIRYQLMINAGTVLENIIVVALGAVTGNFGFLSINSAVIQIIVIVMVAVYSVLTTRTLKENTGQRISDISKSQQQTELLLQTNAQLSRKLTEGITAIHEKMEELSNASRVTKTAMEEVSLGAEDTAKHVHSQMQQTETIQSKVDQVHDATGQIGASMGHTIEALENGNHNVETLVEQVRTSVENGAMVNSKLEALGHYMEKMNTIVELIGGITSQTSMLALNASIEAARAGAAGKGFAVVATEISNMATQTRDATANITDLISDVSAAIREVMGVIADMVSGIDEEKQGAQHAAESFLAIRDNAYAVRSNMEDLVRVVGELNESNQVIVDSVQTISAISQEVSAHAGETMSAEEKNVVIINEIMQIMQELVALAEK